SSLLLGLGEEEEEVEESLLDLRKAGVDILVLGQYLRPTARELPVARYVSPAEFALWAERAKKLGFRAVVSGPLVRTSFRAAEVYEELLCAS
ncbi:MAG: lipoyl synthase, partial [Candidatus Bipolaricaulaceae bacterium]